MKKYKILKSFVYIFTSSFIYHKTMYDKNVKIIFLINWKYQIV